MAMPARAHQLGRLSASDIDAIGDAVAKRVPPLIRAEFARVGLAVGEDDDLVEVQKDHAWLRERRLGSADDKRTFRHKIIGWIVPFVCCGAVAALAAALAQHH